jgi:DNA-binding NtrC family response regulator
VARLAHDYGRELHGISREVFALLRAHSWPGNVRELRNVLERAVLLSSGTVLLPGHLPDLAGEPLKPTVRNSDGEPSGYPPDMPLAEVERRHIEKVLGHVGGHMGRAAEALGLHRNTLTRKARELGLKERR